MLNPFSVAKSCQQCPAGTGPVSSNDETQRPALCLGAAPPSSAPPSSAADAATPSSTADATTPSSAADAASSSGGGKDDTTGGVVGIIVGGLVVVALVGAAVLVVRRRKNRSFNRRKLTDTQLSKTEGVELSINPLDVGQLPAVALEGKPPAPLDMPIPCDVPGWEMYMDNESGQAFYTNTATGETTWEKPDNNGKQNGTITVVINEVVDRS